MNVCVAVVGLSLKMYARIVEGKKNSDLIQFIWARKFVTEANLH